MKRIKSSIKEGLADNVSRYLMYSFFVDLYPLVNKKGGLLTIMFPNVGLNKLSRWVGNIEENELYTNNAESLQKIYSRVSSSTQLKTLYRAVNTLKSKETNSEENDKRISDIQLIIEKIYRVIKTKLTQEERQLFDKFSSLLDGAADQAGKSLEGSIGASTKTVEPTEEPKEEPKEEPEEEKTKAEESLKMEEYLKSLIRELVERKLGLK